MSVGEGCQRCGVPVGGGGLLPAACGFGVAKGFDALAGSILWRFTVGAGQWAGNGRVVLHCLVLEDVFAGVADAWVLRSISDY